MQRCTLNFDSRGVFATLLMVDLDKGATVLNRGTPINQNDYLTRNDLLKTFFGVACF
jgi:hypothetical protein